MTLSAYFVLLLLPALNNMDFIFFLIYYQGCGVGVRVSRSLGFGLESESLFWRRLYLRALSVYLDLCV